MKYDFYFQLHCSNCDFNKSSPEYTMQHVCPKCHSEMKLFTVKFGKHVTDTHLKNILRNLLEQKNQGDDIAKRTFYIISDITDPDVKKVFDEVVSEEYIRKRKLKFSPADSQTATTELATDTPSKKAESQKKFCRVYLMISAMYMFLQLRISRIANYLRHLCLMHRMCCPKMSSCLLTTRFGAGQKKD